MGKITDEIKGIFHGGGFISVFEKDSRNAFEVIAQAIDELDEKQNSQKLATESLDSKKARVLMIVIEKMIVCMEKIETYPRQPQFWFLYQKISRLFEKAKVIKQAENETEFQSAIADL